MIFFYTKNSMKLNFMSLFDYNNDETSSFEFANKVKLPDRLQCELCPIVFLVRELY